MIIVYRGIHLIQITGNVWIIASLPGRIFFTQREAQRAIGGIINESLEDRESAALYTRGIA